MYFTISIKANLYSFIISFSYSDNGNTLHTLSPKQKGDNNKLCEDFESSSSGLAYIDESGP